MGGLADSFLGRRQADAGAHRAGQPWARFGHRRPDCLGQSAQDNHIDGLQAGFQQTPDEDARVFRSAAAAQRATAAHHRTLQHRIDQTGQVASPQIGHHRHGLAQFGQRGGQRLPFLGGP